MATTLYKALKGKDLVDFAGRPASARTSVIVEAKRPPVAPVTISMVKRTALPAERFKPAAKRAGTTKVQRPAAAEMLEVESVLKRMGLASTARRNDLTGSFVVEVTPTQLLQLAETPSVQAIRPNRFHRRVVTA